MIVAGTVEDAVRDSREWIFVDLGFSEKSRSCCMAVGDAEPVPLTFCELQTRALSSDQKRRIAHQSGDRGSLVGLVQRPLQTDGAANREA